jgi:seryl-tRNA synthetase
MSASYCFRRKATHEVDRLQAFRMREFVCMGSPQQALDFRECWITRARAIASDLALPHSITSASDPFFGRGARLIAQNQLDQSLKFEMLIPVRAADRPTACMSFNCHRDHFSST